MRKIICDTQIWYHLAHGFIVKPVDLAIIGTFLTIEELALTKNQDNNLEDVRDVIRMAMKGSNGFYEMPPFHHVAAIDHPKMSKSDYPNIEGFLAYTQLIANEHVTEEIFQQILPYRFKRKELYSELATSMNDVVIVSKQTKIAKKDYWNLNTIPDNRVLLKHWVESSTELILSTEFYWNEIELFERVMEYWFKELALNKTLWVKTNDLADFFNLLYVQPGDLYWCRDKAWNRRIQNAGMGKYLYEVM